MISFDIENGRSSLGPLNNNGIIRISRAPSRDLISELERQAFEAALNRQMRQNTEERATKLWQLSRNNLVIWQIVIVVLILCGMNFIEDDRLKVGNEPYDI